MEPELPPHLDSVRKLLAESLALHPHEQAPAAPSGLLEDLDRHFENPVLRPVREVRPWRERLRTLVASPAFGIAAAVVVMLGLAAPSLFEPFSAPPAFRGGANFQPVQIVLVNEPTGILQMVERSGYFSAGATQSVSRQEQGDSIRGPKVIVDFDTGTLRAVDRAGSECFSAPIPENTADLLPVIDEASTYLH